LQSQGTKHSRKSLAGEELVVDNLLKAKKHIPFYVFQNIDESVKYQQDYEIKL
jgi:hypothetical protein